MKNVCLLLFLVLLIIGCKGEEKKMYQSAVFTGSIKHSNVDSLALWKENFFTWIQVDQEGNFKDTIEVDEKGYYTFRVGNELTTVFLSPQGIHSVSLDTKKFDESLKYSGQNASENNYLAQKFLLSEKISVAPERLKTMPEDSLLELAERHRQKYLNLLAASEPLDSSFKELEKRAIFYKDRLLKETYTLNSNRGYYGENISSSSITAILPEQIDLDNAEDYEHFNDYKSLVDIDFYKNTLLKQDSSTYNDKAFNYIKKLKSQNIKNALAQSMSYRIRAGAADSKEIYDIVLAISDDEEFKSNLTKKFNILEKLKEGNPSPNFSYENFKGGKTSLNDLRGKYVYIDVWATWCSPCLKEIPHLKKIEQQYQGKEIEFVSLSIDSKEAYKKWRKMVTEKGLGGIQLFADNAWNSNFVKDYAVDGIPRFILVDPQGLIVSADAPRPSDPALVEFFESLEI